MNIKEKIPIKKNNDKNYLINKLNLLKAQEIKLIKKINQNITKEKLKKITSQIEEINFLQKCILKLLNEKIEQDQNKKINNSEKLSQIKNQENINNIKKNPQNNSQKNQKDDSLKEKLFFMLTRGGFESYLNPNYIKYEDLDYLYKKGIFDRTLKINKNKKRKNLEKKDLELIFLYSFLSRFFDKKEMDRDMIDYIKQKNHLTEEDYVFLKKNKNNLKNFVEKKNNENDIKYNFKKIKSYNKKDTNGKIEIEIEIDPIENNLIKEKKIITKNNNSGINKIINESKKIFQKKNETPYNKDYNLNKNTKNRFEQKEENYRINNLSETQIKNSNYYNGRDSIKLSDKKIISTNYEKNSNKAQEDNYRTIKITDSQIKKMENSNYEKHSLKNSGDKNLNKAQENNYRTIKITDSQIKKLENSDSEKNSIKQESNYRVIKLTDSQMKNSDYYKSEKNLNKKQEDNYRTINITESQLKKMRDSNYEKHSDQNSNYIKSEKNSNKSQENNYRTIKITDSQIKKLENSDSEKNSIKQESNYRVIKLTDSQMKNSDYYKSEKNLNKKINPILKTQNFEKKHQNVTFLETTNFSKNDNHLFKSNGSNGSNFSKNDPNFEFEKKLIISGEPEQKDYKLELYKNNYIPQTPENEKKVNLNINIINKVIEELNITYEKARKNLIYGQRDKYGKEIIPIEEKGMIFHKFRNDPRTLTPLELDFLYKQKFIQNFISTDPGSFLEEQILYIQIKIKIDETLIEKKKLEELNEIERNKLNNEFYDTRSDNKNDHNISDLMSKEDYSSPILLSNKPTVKNYSSKNYKTFVIEEENSQDIENSNYFSQSQNKSESNSLSNESEKKYLKINNAYKELQADQKHLQKLEKLNYNVNNKTNEDHDILQMSDLNIEKKLNNTSKNLSFSLQSERFSISKINMKNSGLSEKNNIKERLLSEQVINNKITKEGNRFESFKNINNNIHPKDFESDILNNSNLNNSNLNNYNNLQSIVTFKNFGKNHNNSEIKNNDKNDSENFIQNLKDQINYLNKRINKIETKSRNSKDLIELKNESEFLKNEIDEFENKNYKKPKKYDLEKFDLNNMKNNIDHNDSFGKKYEAERNRINSVRNTNVYSKKKIVVTSERKVISPSHINIERTSF